MRKTEIKKMMRHLLLKDMDFCNECYTEWECNCNQYKVVKFDEKGNPTKMRKETYHEICRETVEDALKDFPEDVKKWEPEHIEMFLRGYLYDAFCEHNNTN